MKRIRNILVTLLFLAVSIAAREITVEMWDFFDDGWAGASLKISVNGSSLPSDVTKPRGFGREYFRFNANAGDNVIFYWHKGDDDGEADGECAFAVYYTDEPPSKTFNPQQNDNDVNALLLHKLQNALASVSEGETLGSFTVAPPTPVITVSPSSISLPVGGTCQFGATVKNLDAADKSVTWSVTGNARAGTVIGTNGLLTVSIDETATALTVKAASNANPAIYGTAAVRVNLPYRIGTAAELAAFADTVNNGTDFSDRLVLLTGDIDLSGYGASFNGGKGWIPIGKTITNSRFRGSFDGGGHVIRNLYINNEDGDYAGLFGYIDSIGGSVKNLSLENVNIKGRMRAGGIAGYMNGGSLTNCCVTGSVIGNQYAGGIIGSMSGGSLTNCYSAGSVNGSQYAGGIAGQMIGQGSIDRCYSVAEVIGSNYIGGISGSTDGGISNCAALNPSVKGSNSVGRISGSVQASAALSANIAFVNLLNRAENRNWNNLGPAAIDGENISPNDIRAGGTLGGRFAGSPWVIAAGKLPGLGSAVDMPEHITDFYLLRYVIPAQYGALATDDTVQTIRAGADGRPVTVTENYGYTFVRWSDNSTANPRQDTNVSGDITVTAYFMDEEGNVSVKSADRIIPDIRPKEESTIIAPTAILPNEFTAGPNPAVKQSGIINFYRQGSRIADCELRIYDAFGNVINKIKIQDNALGIQTRRKTGSWNLKDSKGRAVSTGTYLVSGVITTSDRKQEKVSLLIITYCQ